MKKIKFFKMGVGCRGCGYVKKVCYDCWWEVWDEEGWEVWIRLGGLSDDWNEGGEWVNDEFVVNDEEWSMLGLDKEEWSWKGEYGINEDEVIWMFEERGV